MKELIERFKNLSNVQQLGIAGGAAVIFILLIVAIAFAGGDDDEVVADSTTTTSAPAPETTTTTVSDSTTTTSTVDGPGGEMWPLTGVIAAGADPTAPILVAKIDNSASSRPQAGITGADMVIEVLVEGGVARFLAFYQSSIPVEIGPIRSTREVDPKLIEPFGVAFAHSGGTDQNVAAVREVAVDAGHPVLGNAAYGRDPDRPAPYDLMLNPQVALDQASASSGDAWFAFDEEIPQGDQALTVDVALSPLTDVTYRWSSTDGGFLRFHGDRAHEDVEGTPIVATNVIVLEVRQIDTGRVDSAGNAVPDYQVTGSGSAVVFRNGVAVEATWERGDHSGFFRILDASGRPVPLAPGSVWIELLPVGRDLSWQ